MQLIKPDINIDFFGNRKIAYALSSTCILISILALLFQGGLRYGIDFAGGTMIQVKFPKPVEIVEIKKGLGTIDLGHSSVQGFGDYKENEFLIRTDQSNMNTDEYTKLLQTALASTSGGEAEIRRVEMVGPQVGKDLREKASFALFYALLFIAVYISGRFESKWMLSGVMTFGLIGSAYFLSLFGVSIIILVGVALVVTLVLFWFLGLKYAMGAIVALIHDVTITVGLFALLDKEFTLQIIAALLTIVGYSLNDTIVVFDRIRENMKKQSKSPFDVIINRSINETLSRTLLTSGTTLLSLLALFFLGGSIIHDFAFAMTVGIFVGTYSSIYVASPILMTLRGRQKE
jgi:preprotein translocase subunit SecF